jgi:uncharacterized membrane protein YfcA
LDPTLLVAILIVGVTGVIFGMTGFGYALLSVPPLLLLYEPEMVVALTISVGTLTSVIVVATARREMDRRLILLLLPGAFAGLLLGAELLRVVDPTILKIVVGAFVAAYSIMMFRGYQPSGMGSGWAATVAGIASGALTTSTGLSGPPIVILFSARRLTRDAFRVTISAYFVVVNLVGFAILLTGGTIGEREVVTTAVLIPPAALGVLAGTRLARRLSAARFRSLTVGLLLLTGLMGVGTALNALW